MALSKVLQKMAKSHQTDERSSPALSAGGDQEAGATAAGGTGILLSLLTEPPQQKAAPRSSTPLAASKKPPASTSPGPGPGWSGPANGGDRKDAPGRPGAGESCLSRSVLLQLLQEKKMVLAAPAETKPAPHALPGAPQPYAGPPEVSAEPIVITPADSRNGDPYNGRPVDGEADRGWESTEEATLLVCDICQHGFSDQLKFAAHMQCEHGESVEEEGVAEGAPVSLHPEETPPERPLPDTPPPPAGKADGDEAGLRRSKRKRTPSRMKYVDEEVSNEDDLREVKPKMLCVQGDVASPDTAQPDPDPEPEPEPDPEPRCDPELSGSAPDPDPEVSVRSDEESADQADSVIEEITSYRCSQCYLYFNSREEIRVHLRQEHNILSFRNPPNPSSCQVLLAAVRSSSGPQAARSDCACQERGQRKKTAPVKRCVVCGKTEESGVKTFVNIFRVRTWSARHHQLAHRLSQALGYKFSFSNCKSRDICAGCVQKLETVEKASMQLNLMVRSVKRTKLLSVIEEPKVKGLKRMLKTATHKTEAAAKRGSAGGSASIPSAPLVRELLAAPEVLLPQSQFTELIDAIGSGQEPTAGAALSLGHLESAALTREHEACGSQRRTADRRGQAQSRPASGGQHDDAAFNEFVRELRARQPRAAGGDGSPAGEDLGRVLAEVRVKQEPGEGGAGEVAAHQALSESLGLVPAQPADTPPYGDPPDAVVEDLKSLYTLMQIDSRSGQTEYNCRLCSNSFYSEAAIQLHVKCHVSQSKDLQCFLCGYHSKLLPSQWRIMRRHLAGEHNFPEAYFHRFPCPVRGCAELFKCHRDMEFHVSKVHRTPARLAREHALADTGLFNFPCHLCGTFLQSEAALQVHVQCHNGSPKHYQCCFCGYMHTSQPGSWRIMRGHLNKEHLDKELAADTFTYHECPYYACRLKFCSKKAQIVHRACHDETKDGEYFCFQCHYSVPATPYLWEKIRNHIIAKHPEAVGDHFRCTCKARFDSFRAFLYHLNQMQPGAYRS